MASRHSLFFLLIVLYSVSSHSQILEYDTHISVDKGVKTTKRSFLVQVNRPEEIWLSNLSIYHNASQEVKGLKAEIFDHNGKVIRKLKAKEVETRAFISNGTFFGDDLIKEFDLAWNEFPYRFRYSYEMEDNSFIYLAHWLPVYNDNVKTVSAKLTVDVPIDYKYNIHVNGVPNITEQVIAGRRVLSCESSYSNKINGESFSPSAYELFPHVYLVPEEFFYGVEGNSNSWKSYGEWHVKLNEGLDYLTSTEKTKIDQIISANPDTLLLIKELYYYLQDHTRYINVAIDIGGLKPYPATYVCTNKYGDCKALTIYMKALLKYAGIGSNYTVINAGDDAERIIEEYPSQQFNHVVLTVPLRNDTLWIENTVDYLPFGYNGTFTQNRKALAVDLKNSKLINSPALSLYDVYTRREFIFDIDDFGKGTLNLNALLRGELFEKYSYLKRHATTKEFNTEVVKDFKISDSELLEYTVENFERDDFAMSLEIKLRVENQIKNLGSIKVIKPYSIKLPELEKPILRKNAVFVRCPINEEYIVKYSMKYINHSKMELLEDVLIETKFGLYKQESTLIKGEIVVAKHFQLYSGQYQKSDYKEFYEFVESAKKAQNQSIILNSN